MSGLFGFCASTRDGDVAAVTRRMALSLEHGPAMVVTVDACAPQVAVGQRAHTGGVPQVPGHAPRGTVVTWVTGDILGRPAGGATRDARAFVLNAYLERGIEGLTSLDGEFLVCVWDARIRALILVNDRFGLHPHFYAHGAFGVAFAPEMRALLQVPGVGGDADIVAISQFLRFQQLLGDRTWLRGVSRLPPASVLQWSAGDGRLDLQRYWSLGDISTLGEITFDNAVDEGTRLLERAVASRCKAGERIGVFLSGGLDSRILAGLAVDHGTVHTLTYGEAGCRDVHYARRIAAAAGTLHHEHDLVDGRWLVQVMPRHLALTDAQHSFIHAHGMTMLDEASDLIDVNLTGWDGGTVFRGRIEEYGTDPPYRDFTDERALEERLFQGFCQRFTWPGLTDDEVIGLTATEHGRDLPSLARASFAEEFARTTGFAGHRRADYFYAQQHVLRSTINLVVFTRSTMTVRCPYWDYRLVEFLYGLPDRVWATPQFTRAVLTRRLPRLARIPNELDLGIPHENPLVRGAHRVVGRAMRPLRRFVPALRPRSRLYADYEHYLRRELRPWAERLLFDERTLSRGYYDIAALRALWERHVSGRELHTIGKIVPVMAIEMALRYLVDGDTPEQACGLADQAPGATRA